MSRKKGKAQIRYVLSKIQCLDYSFRLLNKGDGYTLQVTYLEKDINTDIEEEQRGRKFYISPWMTETEIVETAWLACQRSMQHRLGEHFLYCGYRVYSPHFTVSTRLEAACKREDSRKDD